jgi:hypothetical protein
VRRLKTDEYRPGCHAEIPETCGDETWPGRAGPEQAHAVLPAAVGDDDATAVELDVDLEQHVQDDVEDGDEQTKFEAPCNSAKVIVVGCSGTPAPVTMA